MRLLLTVGITRRGFEQHCRQSSGNRTSLGTNLRLLPDIWYRVDGLGLACCLAVFRNMDHDVCFPHSNDDCWREPQRELPTTRKSETMDEKNGLWRAFVGYPEFIVSRVPYDTIPSEKATRGQGGAIRSSCWSKQSRHRLCLMLLLSISERKSERVVVVVVVSCCLTKRASASLVSCCLRSCGSRCSWNWFRGLRGNDRNSGSCGEHWSKIVPTDETLEWRKEYLAWYPKRNRRNNR